MNMEQILKNISEVQVPIFMFRWLQPRTLSLPSCRTNVSRHESWETARLQEPKQGKSRDRGRFRTTDLPVRTLAP
ncbi:hypothetical protein T265_03235 [Opisthorchis viverrini]|uniref:Uncharacterized protein n=1 Tax=Opisthorchis viverrini TaxID=6198 RepID=A0A075AHQ3_OPIVI|nr:hypothetical protein T265_03235 [Opisthorchis viverrini]KER30284.1 hypothetical protein T265_03235 [Opisthorchis viverrini]